MIEYVPEKGSEMNRRNFIKTAALAPLFGAVGASASTPTAASSGQAWSGKNHPLAGKKLPSWKPGEFQVHFIYTGVAESMFSVQNMVIRRFAQRLGIRRIPHGSN